MTCGVAGCDDVLNCSTRVAQLHRSCAAREVQQSQRAALPRRLLKLCASQVQVPGTRVGVDATMYVLNVVLEQVLA